MRRLVRKRWLVLLSAIMTIALATAGCSSDSTEAKGCDGYIPCPPLSYFDTQLCSCARLPDDDGGTDAGAHE